MGQNEATDLRNEILKYSKRKHLEKCLFRNRFVHSEPSSYFKIKIVLISSCFTVRQKL